MPPVTRALLICDEATVPEALDADLWPVRLPVVTRGSDPQFNFSIENLIGKLGGGISPRVHDVLALGAYCFAADRMVPRTAPIDVNRERWRRELNLCVPVEDYDFWSQPKIGHLLADTLNFGTDDRWTFHFSRIKRSIPQFEIEWDDRELLENPDTVILFSGGTDSLCGLVDAVANGARPVLVSQWGARQVKRRQQTLRTAVRRHAGGWEFPHVLAAVKRTDQEEGESSGRTRGFLFASLGAAVAAHLHIPTVLLPENGYVSVNPRVNDQLVGALASRGAHPKFIALFNRFIGQVFGGSVEVRNPLWNQTRAESLSHIATAGAQHLLQDTYSCGKLQGRLAGKPHCGKCSQCIDRRFSMLFAGLEEQDPALRYEIDPLLDPLPEGEARTMAISHVRFAEELRDLSAEAILDVCTELDLCADANDPNFDMQLLGIAEVLRRHAQEVLAVMGAAYETHAQALADHTLSPYCLLRLWLAHGTLHSHPPINDFGVPFVSPPLRYERWGEAWNIEFNGERSGLKDHEGPRRLARILKASPTGIPALDLRAGGRTDPQGAEEQDALVSQDVHESWQMGAGTILDDDAVSDFRRRVEELDRDIKVLITGGKMDQIAPLQDEKDWIGQTLRAGLGLGGRLRSFTEEHERARQTVNKTVWAAVQQLASDMPMFVAHLQKFLHTGFVCSYRPDPRESWHIRL